MSGQNDHKVKLLQAHAVSWRHYGARQERQQIQNDNRIRNSAKRDAQLHGCNTQTSPGQSNHCDIEYSLSRSGNDDRVMWSLEPSLFSWRLMKQ
jgi:hypothetical protein